MDAIASLTVALSSASVVAVIATFLRNYRAERALIKRMKDENQEGLLHALEVTRRQLESRPPDPEAVAMATTLIGLVAEGLSEGRKKKDVLGLLSHGSERSKANYIAKLIDEAEVERAS